MASQSQLQPQSSASPTSTATMKCLVLVSCLLACSQAQIFYTTVPYLPAPAHHYAYTVASAGPVYAATSTQFHAQDALGQFAFHHAGDNQARSEAKTLDGAVRGAYSYVDPTGKLINVHYLADSNGYRVLGANNLPEAPAALPAADIKAPEPVQDTPEVLAARAAFQKQYEEAAKAAEAAPETAVESADATPLSRRRRQAVLLPLVGKATVKYHEFEPVEGAPTPADTKRAELKEKEQEIPFIPLGYSALHVAPKLLVL